MAKKKEVCPYCGNSFAYLSRHKCKVKERIEGSEESDKSDVERRLERIEERKKEGTRSLRKDEKMVLRIINQERDIFFHKLLELTNKKRMELDKILGTLYLQDKIDVNRELLEASWVKRITIIEKIDVKVKDINVNQNNNDFILDIFSHQPCLTCPFTGKCNNTNLDQFNPLHCPWLTQWVKTSIDGQIYKANFEEIQSESLE
ncbi:MAG: hypothetical protein CEE42_11785 [Promethearchaeota archaeon Loki_b31]|nr:MAG: hypothetical protein CEE42_11785 [Candidatus Lokiarchaeota archaeon Loki_b31]